MTLLRTKFIWFNTRGFPQTRRFSSLFSSIFSKHNPILDGITASRSDRHDTISFRKAQPHHASAALKTISSTMKQQLEDIIQTKPDSSDLVSLLKRLDQTMYPIQSLHMVVFTLMRLEYNPKERSKWSKEVDECISAQPDLSSIAKRISPLRGASTGAEDERVANFIARTQLRDNGFLMEKDQEREAFSEYSEALESIKTSLKAARPVKSMQLIKDMYNLIGIQTEQAKLLGYENFAQWIMVSRMASIEKLLELQQSISAFTLTQMRLPGSNDFSALDDHQTNSLPPSDGTLSQTREEHVRDDEQVMIRLENYVTLDGALLFASHLLNDILGVHFKEATEHAKMWKYDGRLFHVYEGDDDSKLIGSFYLDPFHGETSTCQVFAASEASEPILYVTLGIEQPVWDTDPVMLSWDDIACLLREFGCVVDLLLIPRSYGSLGGMASWPLDRTKVLPKFMEHWLMERSTIFSLIHMSKGDTSFSEESLDAALRVQSRKRVLELAQHSFMSALELKLFTNFDLKGQESILALQHRLATELAPEIQDADSIVPLFDIMQNNASNRPMASYIDLWSDVLSASAFAYIREKYILTDETSDVNKEKVQHLLRDLTLSCGASTPIDGIDWLDPKHLFDRYKLS